MTRDARVPIRCARGLLCGLMLAALAAGGCAEPGRLVITLDRPSADIDPMSDPRLSKFSLRIVRGGTITDQDAFLGEAAEVEVGDVPAGEPFDLRLAAKSTTGQMLGLGLVLDVIAAANEETHVQVNLRKPLGYIAGEGTLLAVDSSVDRSGSLEKAALAISGAIDVASSPIGDLVLVAAGENVVPVRTADHRALTAVKLAAAATCASVSPDSRFAVFCHGSKQAVSIVDLDELRAGTLVASPVLVGGTPHRIVFGSERDKAYVLLDRQRHLESCSNGGASSQLVEVDLTTGKAGQPRALGGAVSDVAIDPRDGSLLLALPCEDRLRRLSSQGSSDLATIGGAFDLAVADQYIVTLGTVDTSKGRGLALLFDLSRPGFQSPTTKEFPLPPITIALRGTSTSSGYFGWVSEPQDLSFYDVAVSPDGQRALALFLAVYASDMSFGECLFRARTQAIGYLLIDLMAGSVLAQRFTRLDFSDCYANCVNAGSGAPLTTTSVCASMFKQAMLSGGGLASPEMNLSGLAVLFGGS